ncbi:hypothetical protein SDC9_148682 [bioreactor metagenome]|uniref:Uncharacterized protein n=1 Tax=bioreactor metagenome TaxID=1076179 RepID=A0A645ELQ5_9ZZZZ
MKTTVFVGKSDTVLQHFCNKARKQSHPGGGSVCGKVYLNAAPGAVVPLKQGNKVKQTKQEESDRAAAKYAKVGGAPSGTKVGLAHLIVI